MEIIFKIIFLLGAFGTAASLFLWLVLFTTTYELIFMVVSLVLFVIGGIGLKFTDPDFAKKWLDRLHL